jgi:TfoX/Sxy family transcriptional regulator of competence genes
VSDPERLDLKTADEALIARIRPLLKRRKGISDKKLFGGVCFMVNGNMCAGTWQGSLVVRLDKPGHEAVLREEHTAPFDATGRVMKGWALIAPAGIDTPDTLRAWLDRAVRYARSLPPK